MKVNSGKRNMFSNPCGSRSRRIPGGVCMEQELIGYRSEVVEESMYGVDRGKYIYRENNYIRAKHNVERMRK